MLPVAGPSLGRKRLKKTYGRIVNQRPKHRTRTALILGNGTAVASADSIRFGPTIYWVAIEMSAESLTVLGIGSRLFSPIAWVPPRSGFSRGLAARGQLAMAFLKARQFLEALKGTPRKLPGSGGPQEPPEEDHPAADGIWNDPTFWVLLAMH
jgi:hypothetical protein